MKRVFSGLIVILLCVGMLTVAVKIQPVLNTHFSSGALVAYETHAINTTKFGLVLIDYGWNNSLWMNELKSSGCAWIRTNVYNSGRSLYNDSLRCLELLHNESVKCIGVFGRDLNVWNASTTPPATVPINSLSEWQTLVHSALQNYGPFLDAVECWNEPDLTKNQIGYMNASASTPQHYFEMLQILYNETKMYAQNYNKTIDVVAGAVVNIYTQLNIYPNGTFIQTIKALGSDGFCDAYSMHIYKGDNDTEAFLKGHTAKEAYEYIKNITDANTMNPKPLWVSEMGTHNNTDTEQASQMQTWFDELYGVSCPIMFWYNYVDPVEGLHGILKNGTLAETPAYHVYRQWAAAITVPDDYPTIQGAIDASNDGDLIFVRNGTYHENVVVNKTLSLIGENVLNTTIVGVVAGSVVYINADSVNVTGFTISNSTYLLPPSTAGISLDNANYCNIYGNSITTNNQTGVYLGYSNNNSITENTITENGGNGIDIISSNGNIVARNNITKSSEGVLLTLSNDNLITDNNVTANKAYGVFLGFSSSNSILGNNITDNSDGVYVASSSGNSIVENSITGSYDGVHLVSCNSSIVQGNSIKCFWDGLFVSLSNDNNMTGNSIVAGHRFGIEIEFSTGNTLRNNQMTSNRLNFGVIGSSLSDFLNDADSSNTVDGKPVCYWVNRQGEVVPANAGYVAVVNSTGMTVRNLDLRNNCQGVLFAFTSNSTITGNNIDNNDEGVYLVSSGDISIVGNSITNAGYGVQLVSSSDNGIEENNLANDYSGLYLDSSNSNSIKGNSMTANSGNGVFLDSSNNNSLCGNKITDGDIGVHLQDYSSNNSMCGNAVSYCTVGIGLEDSCNNNTVTGNNITANNYYSIWLWDSSNNTFYHNNFVTLSMQVYTSNSANVWDDGYPYGGNHWSSYLGVDHYSGPYQNTTGSDGIGDTAYVIDNNNKDRYPLMRPWYPIAGDINGDCKVSLQDLVLLANAYGSRPGNIKWNPNADINGNGIVDLIDLVILAQHYGQHNP